jgi:NAD(P)-dependent dehydrogenase (short-subunit alcohol dehydrogenase family)
VSEDFNERRIIVTGGATGVGAALLDLLAEQGAVDVTVLDVKAPSGPHARFLPTDLADRAAVDAAIAAIEGPVDVLFNNAGVADTLPPLTVFQVNALAPVHLGQALLPQLREGGTIVNTASIAGLRWADNLLVIGELLDLDDWEKSLAWFDGRDLGVDTYSFTKQVMQVWTMRFSKAASANGVRVNSVCPAPIDTPLLADFRATLSDAAIDWSIAAAGGRLVTPREVAQCLAWLAGPTSSFVNGVNLNIDGGLVAALTTGRRRSPVRDELRNPLAPAVHQRPRSGVLRRPVRRVRVAPR